MSKAKFTALLGLVESEDEDTSEILEPVAQPKGIARMPAAKKGRPAAASKVTKPTPTAATRRAGGRPAAASTVATERKALAEKTTNAHQKPAQGRGKKRRAEEEIEMTNVQDQNAVEVDAKPKGTRGRPRAAKAAKIADAPTESTLEEQPEPVAQPARRGRKPKAQVATPPTETEIPETQPVEVEAEIPETQPIETFEDTLLNEALDDSIEDEQIEELPSYNRAAMSSVQRPQHHAIPLSANRPQHHVVPFSASRSQHHVVPYSASRRPMAASDSELNDPSMRRRIGDLSRKYENLEIKYRDLREIGVKEAERNYDKLRRQGEERTNTANHLIEALKAQLAAQTELAKEGQRLKQQLEASESKAADLQIKVTEITGSLSEAKAEIKTLSTKLAASRAAENASTKVPGSAIKGNMGNSRLLVNAEAAAQLGQIKEDLYGDLTGLIIRGVKREKNDEIYDCIQTGRNGTLHFKLSITPDEESEDFDEAQFMYMPQLDPNRDRALIDLLPEYLVEEITFPRPHAAKFYARVMKSLTDKLD
ncbi:chromosome segregation protein [Xylariales sp. AK1849]|nr:chromosome segregation protein [Xylariales sp. AK1849]